MKSVVKDDIIFLEIEQKITTSNKRYNYKEITIPAVVYQHWKTNWNDEQDIKQVSLITVIMDGVWQSYLTPKQLDVEEAKKQLDENGITQGSVCIVTLSVRINKSKPDKQGNRKQKATMKLVTKVSTIGDSCKFKFYPCIKDYFTGINGLVMVDGIYIDM